MLRESNEMGLRPQEQEFVLQIAGQSDHYRISVLK